MVAHASSTFPRLVRIVSSLFCTSLLGKGAPNHRTADNCQRGTIYDTLLTFVNLRERGAYVTAQSVVLAEVIDAHLRRAVLCVSNLVVVCTVLPS